MNNTVILTYEKVRSVTIIFTDGSRHRIENVRVDVYENFMTIMYRTSNKKVRIIPFTNVTNIILEVE